MSKKEIVVAIIIIIVAVAYAGYLTYRDVKNNPGGPNQSADWKNYTNSEYGFKLTFPESWKGFTVVKSSWQGRVIDTGEQKYSGVELIIKNPQTTAQQVYQDIPIMVFTPAEWAMVSGDNPTVAISAAPIGPAEIGQNAKYVFATPPRWYGFTDAIGFQEAVDIVKTFKAF